MPVRGLYLDEHRGSEAMGGLHLWLSNGQAEQEVLEEGAVRGWRKIPAETVRQRRGRRMHLQHPSDINIQSVGFTLLYLF